MFFKIIINFYNGFIKKKIDTVFLYLLDLVIFWFKFLLSLKKTSKILIRFF